MTEQKASGGCMCGTVRYEVDTTAAWNVYCHCESCRRHTGAPVVMLVTVRPENVTWTKGERARFESSPERYRGFCSDCGSSLTWEAELEDSWLAIHINSLDNPETCSPTEHVFYGERLPWFDTDDELPRHVGSKYI